VSDGELGVKEEKSFLQKEDIIDERISIFQIIRLVLGPQATSPNALGMNGDILLGMYWFSASSLQVRLVRGPASTCETAAAINARLQPEMMQKRGGIAKLPGMPLGLVKSHKAACHIREETVGHSRPASTGASALLYASRLLFFPLQP
jgi:hypothetical protein